MREEGEIEWMLTVEAQLQCLLLLSCCDPALDLLLVGSLLLSLPCIGSHASLLLSAKDEGGDILWVGGKRCGSCPELSNEETSGERGVQISMV